DDRAGVGHNRTKACYASLSFSGLDLRLTQAQYPLPSLIHHTRGGGFMDRYLKGSPRMLWKLGMVLALPFVALGARAAKRAHGAHVPSVTNHFNSRILGTGLWGMASRGSGAPEV